MSLEELFSSAVLNVLIPDTSLEFPPKSSPDDWLTRSRSESVERNLAFFDEQLQFFLTLRINHLDDPPPDPTHPPQALLSLLAHIQVSLDASYISTANTPDTPRTTTHISAPPRTVSLAVKSAPGIRPPGSHHPSIFPPSTPNPFPSSGDQDKKYAAAEGTLLLHTIWGASTAEDSPDAFSLLWSEEEGLWVAVYQLGLTVSFLRLNFNDPLLCLTVSATLREKPVVASTAKHPLLQFFASIGEQSVIAPDSPVATEEQDSDSADEEKMVDGLEEVNLLEGLHAGTTFSDAGPHSISFPSSRLGDSSRRALFALPPIAPQTPPTPSPSPLTAVRKAHPTLRKSFRKTIQTASGFKVRMRTVFVPFVLLPSEESKEVVETELDDAEKDKERREAGSEERTVVLCVEIENEDVRPDGVGFEVERVAVNITGEGAKATLIGWGDKAFFSPEAAAEVFPLRISPQAQYNLLYAVTFLRSPEEIDAFSFARSRGPGTNSDLQRAVTINVFGKPYGSMAGEDEPQPKPYPTRTFSSRWNCVLDLSANPSQAIQPQDEVDPTSGYPSVLPEPASPFPVFLRTGIASSRMGTGTWTGSAGGASFPPSPATATVPSTGNNRHPSAAAVVPRRTPMLPSILNLGSANRPSIRASTSASPFKRISSPLSSVRSSASLPGTVTPIASAQYMRSPTTYSAPPPIPPQGYRPLGDIMDDAPPPSAAFEPPTPAYPAFPPRSSIPQTPMALGPVSLGAQLNVGASIDIRRDVGASVNIHAGGGAGVAVPQTPGPVVPGAFGEQKMIGALSNAAENGESVVVSVGLLPFEERKDGIGKIYPFDIFTLDIFVFNQCGWPRRFEVTCPMQKRKRDEGLRAKTGGGGLMGYPGVLPMDSRVRIGPLRPSACQSVRMNFLAVSHGVHSIEVLKLTDIETGFSMNLRSVLDVVVHDPGE